MYAADQTARGNVTAEISRRHIDISVQDLIAASQFILSTKE
jgi:hypothetical protein